MKNLTSAAVSLFVMIAVSVLVGCSGKSKAQLNTLPSQCQVISAEDLKTLAANFHNPPKENRAWVYWFVIDGNLSREGITADLEAMQRVGIGGAIFLEVSVGLPRGEVDFMSEKWIELFAFACKEAERLDIELTLISGPGWTGSGGPWVKPEDAMHFIVADTLSVRGGETVSVMLPRPKPLKPYFGLSRLTPEMLAQREAYYEDLFVLAYPKVDSGNPIANIDEKALYVRHPYSSMDNVKPFLEMPAQLGEDRPGTALLADGAIDLTAQMTPDGHLTWNAPKGEWVIYRFGRTLTGTNTRPAPAPGLGFECSKMDTAAFNHHFDAFIGTLMKATGRQPHNQASGWNMLHIDSWEMGSQNWSNDFREQFIARRGYDPKPYLPALSGQVMKNSEVSERFLWDFRTTVQELILENHATHLKEMAHRYGFGLSIQPYDMNPTNDIALGSIADVPMGETWEMDGPFNTAFSCIEAVSAAHLNNRPIVGAEAFTDGNGKLWRLHPGNMKNQADWAFCMGMNRLVFHRYTHQPWLDRFPGMTMDFIGTNYERTQTWWELSQAWHTYLARCQYLLRQGQGVADVLLLTPEGAPHAFTPPVSALGGTDRLPDKKGYNFDGCDPGTFLEKATVRNGNIYFPGGMEYRLLVLPTTERMTPELLHKIDEMIHQGARVLGFAPKKSPSLVNYPACDKELEGLADQLWGDGAPGSNHKIGRGRLFIPNASDTIGMELSPQGFKPPYVNYEAIVATLAKLDIAPDFESSASLRYIHRRSNDLDIYMISNPSAEAIAVNCTFRVAGKSASLWDAVQGTIAPTDVQSTPDGRSRIAVKLEAYGSIFVIFSKEDPSSVVTVSSMWPELHSALQIAGPWEVEFQAKRGAPDKATFAQLTDWSKQADPGIKYFSGIAYYTNQFSLSASDIEAHKRWYLDLGGVEVMARVEVNGKVVTELWNAPYLCEITSFVQAGANTLRISVANEWPNRMVGDLFLPEDKRITFSTYSNFTKDFKLLPSGLLGPVQVSWSE